MRAFLLLLLSVLLVAAEPRVDVAATPAAVPVGKTIELVVSYSWPAGWTVAAEPDPSAELSGLFITRAAPVERTSTGEGERRVFRYTVAAPRSGAWALPRPRLTATGPSGTATSTASEVVIQVGADNAPPKLPAAKPLRVLPPEPPASRWWPWAAGAAVLVLIAALAFWLRRRAVAARIPPVDVARAALARLDQQDGKSTAAGLSLVLRTYAGAVGGFDGPGQTPREIGFALSRTTVFTTDEARVLVRLLERLDDLRWTPADLPADQVLPLVSEGRLWLDAREARIAAEAEATKKP
jgi:hypothetical protein